MTGNEGVPIGGAPDIETELRELRAWLAVPEPAAGTVTAVMARLDQVPRTSRGQQWLHKRWRAVTVIVVGVLLAVLAVSPAGAAIREWLGFGAVVVEQEEPVEDGSATAPSAEPQGAQLSLEQARAAVNFPVVVPAELGEPDQVTVAPDRRVVMMQWDAAASGPIRLDQIGGSLAPYYVKKYYGDVTFTMVDGGEALWFSKSHPIVVLDPDGTERTESARESGPTLLWQRPGVTLRLEGIDDQRAAESIAGSVSD